MLEVSREPYLAEQQMRAFIFCLVAFGYIDGELDPAERRFIEQHLQALAEHRARSILGSKVPHADVAADWAGRWCDLVTVYEEVVRSHFSESVADGESHEAYVLSRLKLGCLELLRHFDGTMQAEIVAAVEELMHADGRVHPNEKAFFDEVVALMNTVVELEEAELEVVAPGSLVIDAPRPLAARMPNHPFFRAGEWDFSRDPEQFVRQCQTDLELVERVRATLDEQRSRGAGKLGTARTAAELPTHERFLDGRVHAQNLDPARSYELLVLGDLHGCYSCMKAALLQADFFEKVRRHREAPDKHPEMLLVLLGDYIDRGKFGYSGTLRTAMQLYAQFPDNIVMLRGNHEYYVEVRGRVVSPVRPCEAIESVSGLDSARLLTAYMKLFDELPTSFVFGSTLFVHGGIPRDGTIDERFRSLASLNEHSVYFEMMWSDPSSVDVVPPELQREVARFSFGRRQFQRFMKLCGCRLMVRGHERVIAGFARSYDDPEATLLTIFSAGGASNADLPPKSNYRQVTPMALTVRYSGGVTTATPFAIEYPRFNDPKHNSFFQRAVSGEAS